MKVLVTCPPMLGLIDEFRPRFSQAGVELHAPNVVQTLTEQELIGILPTQDGWIAGDDPASRKVLKAGAAGRLKAVVKWGIGTDNVDFAAAREFGLKVSNTPGMFGAEVADVAMAYLIGLARSLFVIERGVRAGGWPKPRGVSLQGKVLALVGLGDIGGNVATRARAAGMELVAFDPRFEPGPRGDGIEVRRWPDGLALADFLVLTCPLTSDTRHMIDQRALALVKPGLRFVNVARGQLVDEGALIRALEQGIVHSAALDVLEQEPLPANSPLRTFERCIFGSHNASNTLEGVRRASERAISQLFEHLAIE